MDDKTVTLKMTATEWRKLQQVMEKEDKKNSAVHAKNTGSKTRAFEEAECTCSGWSIEHDCGMHGEAVRAKAHRYNAFFDDTDNSWACKSTSIKRPTQVELGPTAKHEIHEVPMKWSTWDNCWVYAAKEDSNPAASGTTTPAERRRTCGVPEGCSSYDTSRPLEAKKKIPVSPATKGFVASESYDTGSNKHGSGTTWDKYMAETAVNDIDNSFGGLVPSARRPAQALHARSADYMVHKVPTKWSSHAEWLAFVEKEIDPPTAETSNHLAKLFRKVCEAAHASDSRACADFNGDEMSGRESMSRRWNYKEWSSSSPIIDNFTPSASYNMASNYNASHNNEQAIDAESNVSGGDRTLYSRPASSFSGARYTHVPQANHQTQYASTVASNVFDDWPRCPAPSLKPSSAPSPQIPTGWRSHLRRELQKHIDENGNLRDQLEEWQQENAVLQAYLREARHDVAGKNDVKDGIKSDSVTASNVEDGPAPSVLSQGSGGVWGHFDAPAADYWGVPWPAGSGRGSASSAGDGPGVPCPADKGWGVASSAGSFACKSEGAASAETYVYPQPQHDYHITVVPKQGKLEPVKACTVNYGPPRANRAYNNLLAIYTGATAKGVLDAWCEENGLNSSDHLLVHKGEVLHPYDRITDGYHTRDNNHFEILKLKKQEKLPADFDGW